MTRQDMIDLLSNALSTAQVESQETLGADDSVSVLITPTGRMILTLLDPEVESVRAILSKGGGAELAAFVVDLLLDQIKCEWCPTNLEKPTQALLGHCGPVAPFLASHEAVMQPIMMKAATPTRRWFGRTWWSLRG